MLGLATTKDLEFVEDELVKAVNEICVLRRSLRLISKEIQTLKQDNKTSIEMHIVKVEDEPKPKKVATKTIKPRKKATKKEV